jgi:peptidoglycan hydrolase CwlO-like protein
VKKLISPLLTILIIFASYAYTVTQGDLKKLNAHDLMYYSPCEIPVRFKIGTVDERFKISEKQILANVTKAADIWNKAYGREVFVYDPNGEVPIDFIYDKRQGLSSQINQLEKTVNKNGFDLKSQMSEYDSRVASFKQRLTNLNLEIEEWNSKGGAPPDEYARLKREQEDLQKEADSLNAKAQELNITADSYNSQVGNLNQTITTFNQALSQKPEEGLYKGDTNSIEIYFVNGTDELIHTIAHELGHAHGIDHNMNKKSIMYPFTNESLKLSDEDLQGLKDYCQDQNYYDIFKARFQYVISQYKSSK